MPTEEELQAEAAAKVAAEAKAKADAEAAAKAKTESGNETPEETIARLTKEVKSARSDAARERVNSKAAVETETLKKVGVALGLIVEDNPDPAKLLAQVQEAQGKAKFAEVQLAVFHAADASNANARALLDSRSFLEKVARIDTTDETALKAVIEEAVKDNPSLAKTTDARPAARPDYSQASGANNRTTLSDGEIFAAWMKAKTNT